DVQRIDGYLTVSAKALASNHNAMSELIKATVEQVRFDELPRLRELIAQIRARREQSITGNGHSLAMAAASAGMAPAAKLSHELGGLAGIARLKTLDQQLDDAEALKQFAQQLLEIHQLVLQAPKQFLLVGETEQLDRYRDE